MDKELEDVCSDPTEEITIRIPCTLAERIDAYASDHQTTLSGAIIEAVDFFLRQVSK